MNLGWKAANVNRTKGTTSIKNRQDKVKFCKICGKPTAGGHLCQSCSDFMKRKKQEERQIKHDA